MPMARAARLGDIFCTVTGNCAVLRPEHFRVMKNGAIVCNSGHFNVELDLAGLRRIARKVSRVREFVDAYELGGGRAVFVLAEGRLINLAAAHGHPASVMDMSFAVQALMAEYAVAHQGEFAPAVYTPPPEIDANVSALKLKSMGVAIDRLTPAQKKYLASWQEGT